MYSDSLPELRSLELLETIARTGSITLAASELGVTQQAASMRLRRLEQRLGRTLVVRAARASHLTADGLAVLQLARPVLAAAVELDAELERYLAAEAQVPIAASLTVAEHFLPQWIMAYARAGNDIGAVKVKVTNTREVVQLVSRGEAALGFTEGSEPPRGLSHALVATDEIAVYVSPQHEWAQTRRISPWTLAKTPLVTREEGSGCRSVLLAALLAHGVEREALSGPALELPTNTATLEAAVANVAPAVTSTRPAQAYVDDGRLVRVAVGQLTFHRDLIAIWKSGQVPSARLAQSLLAAATGAAAAAA